MRNLQTLYRFELKKILSRKIVWITIAIMLILTGFTTCGQLMGGYYVEGKKLDTTYNMFLKAREIERALTGRVIDQQLLDETWNAYGKIPAVRDIHYLGTEEYWEYAFPYSGVFNFVRNVANMNDAEAMVWEADEAELYSRRQAVLEDGWNGFHLTEGEKAYWRSQELSVEKPVEYAYKDGWMMLLYDLYTIGLVAQLTIAVCLSNVFTVEQTRKTDQLILCSRYGKGTLYLAKMLAGISFSAGVSLLYSIAAFALSMAVYGGDGFTSAIQLLYPEYSAPLSIGGVALIGYGLMVAGSILTAVFTMVLSEILRNGIGTLAAVGGITILSMFILIPVQYRVLAQIWNYLPCVFVDIQNLLDYRLVPFFGTYLTNMQFVPILYIVTGGLLSVVGLKIYQRYQVRAR